MRLSRLRAGVGLEDSRQQCLGVGMLRVLENVVGRGDFNDSADVHHGNPVADLRDHVERVGNEQVGQAKLGLEVLE